MDNLMTLWSSDPAISGVIWAVILITVLYLGRRAAHQMITSTFRLFHSSLRLWAAGVSQLTDRLIRRNREVLLANGAAEAKTRIEREFNRVNAIVQRDLSQYPAIHRQICDAIGKVETDYQNSTESAPLPPAWGDVLSTISSLPTNGDPAVNKILTNIRQSIDEAHQQTLSAYRKSGAERQKILAKMQPGWRSLEEKMEQVNGKIESLDERTRIIDEQMQHYEDIRNDEDKAVSVLTTSSLTQFFIAGLVLTIALLGGLINFQLIAMPMSEMVGGASYIGSVKTSDIAALVIILIEIAMGLFLLESLRITHLFPIIGSMDDRMRKRMMMISFSILFILAGIEASLAYMRDLLAMDQEALQQSLVGAAASVEATGHGQFRWIPSIGQMIMGFILPFALAFIAIPLESFIHSLRTVLGLIATGLLRVASLALRTAASLMTQLSRIVTGIYDLIIAVPLSAEKLIIRQLQNKRSAKKDTDTKHNDEKLAA